MDAQGWYLSSTGCSGLTHVDRGPRKSHCESNLLFENLGEGSSLILTPSAYFRVLLRDTHGVLGKAMSPGWEGS